VELEVQRTEEWPDDVPVELLADQSEIDELDQGRLELKPDVLTLVGAEGGEVGLRGGNHGTLRFSLTSADLARQAKRRLNARAGWAPRTRERRTVIVVSLAVPVSILPPRVGDGREDD